MQYAIKIQWSAEDQLFVAWVPELPRCMAHGDDYRTALENVLDAMAAHLKVCAELGRVVPEPNTRLEMDWIQASTVVAHPN